jgi:choline dehydrogenase-like flavoprotein
MDTAVCIVGAGAAGSIMAAELTRRGVDVVVLEAGPRHDFARRAEYARRFLKGDNPWRAPLTALERHTSVGAVPYTLEWNRVRGVGGGTLHWEGYAFRFHPDDFRLRTLYAVGEDWPLTYADLEPYYRQAEESLGVAGAADDPWGPPRSSAFPLPAFPFSHADRFYREAASALGIAVAHMPQARNSAAYDGRARCSACTVCHACPTGAKASVDLTHIARAEASGRATVLADVSALRLDVDASDRVSTVTFAGHDGKRRQVTPRICVVAGGAVETARLLLLSASTRFPTGLANRSGLVGKYFMSHPSIDVTGRLTERVYPYRTGFSTATSRQFAVGAARRTRAGFFLEFLNSAEAPLGRQAAWSAKWGAELREHVRERFGRSLGVRVYCEQLPELRNSVSLDPDARDHFGDPVPRLTWNVGAYEGAALQAARGVATRILEGTGALGVTTTAMRYASHQMGTHRMGDDPRASVVDGNLRAHDVANLYLVGAGCFVTGTPSPPTLTIAALAIRAADHIATLIRRPA